MIFPPGEGVEGNAKRKSKTYGCQSCFGVLRISELGCAARVSSGDFVVKKNCGNMSRSSSRLRIWYCAAWVVGSGSPGSTRCTVFQPRAYA